MAILNITVAMALIAVGFVLFTWGIDSTDATARNVGGFLILVAIIMWIASIPLVKRERNEQLDERNKKHNELLAELKGIRTDLTKRK